MKLLQDIREFFQGCVALDDVRCNQLQGVCEESLELPDLPWFVCHSMGR